MRHDAVRRRFLQLAASLGLLPLAACDATDSKVISVLDKAEALTKRAQRLVVPRTSLAREFAESDIAPVFKPNGSINPHDATYRKLAQGKFADWKLPVDGLVENPLSLSLADLRALPARTQITRHDCVEGWSCIGKWTGAPLAAVLDRARPKPEAKYVVFHCFDSPDADENAETPNADDADAADDQGQSDPYYESLDFVDARHPQTILAYAMNGADLPIAHGAPLRLRAERQLGYKMAKYIKRIELVDSFARLGQGKGGYWEDRGYEWFAGI